MLIIKKIHFRYQNKNHARNKALTYPKAVIFVLLSKFFEAFAANGVRSMQSFLSKQKTFRWMTNYHVIIYFAFFYWKAILALYLRDSLNFSEESSMTFYHIFNFFSQFCPIFGMIMQIVARKIWNRQDIHVIFFSRCCTRWQLLRQCQNDILFIFLLCMRLDWHGFVDTSASNCANCVRI